MQPQGLSRSGMGQAAPQIDAVAARHIRCISGLVQRPLIELIYEKGLISREQWEAARAVEEREGGDAVLHCVAMGFVDVERLLDFLARLPMMCKCDLDADNLPLGLARLAPESQARRLGFAPIKVEAKRLLIGVARPLTRPQLHEIEAATGLTAVMLLCSEEDMELAFQRLYNEGRNMSIETGGPQTCLSLTARLIRDIEELPALPETVNRIREAMLDARSSVQDAGRIIMMDPPIAAKVLSVANSAAYGFPQQIENLHLAVALLGLRETYSIVLSVAVLNLVEKCRHIDYKRFWLESICCAGATRFVLKAAGMKHLDGAFAAGLLHDIGRVALAEVAPALASKVDTGLRGVSLIEAETKCLGLSHTEAGYHLARRWDLPEEMAEAIRYHHEPAKAALSPSLTAVVALADAMALAPGSTLEENKDLFIPHEEPLRLLDIDEELAEAMLDEFLARRDESLREGLR